MKYTASQRDKLIERFNLQTQERRQQLTQELAKTCSLFEARIRRVKATVPKKFTTLQIADVLAVERDHQLKIYTLLRDIEQLRRAQQGLETAPAAAAAGPPDLRNELQQLQSRRLRNQQTLQRRKQSLAATGRVSKPPK